jgi:hypothetical protein
MSKYEWDTTASNNDDADSNINWQEGQLPSTVNNSARAMMAAEAAFMQGTGGALTTGGTGAAYTLTLPDAPTAYTSSMLFLVRFHTVSTSTTATLNVNGLGAKTLKTFTGAALPEADHISANAYAFVKYDGTDFRVYLPGITTGSLPSDPEFNTIELGHASDTTLARSSAGNMSIEGNLVYRAGGTDVPVADGGTGASTAANARTNLSVPGLDTNNTFSLGQTFGAFSSTGASDGKLISSALVDSSRDTTSSTNHARFFNPNGNVGEIRTSGTSTSYNTTSDGALKDEVTDADRASISAKIKAGRPVEFEFKGERGIKHLGFIAQEMYEIHPDAVTPGEDETPWMMDHSKLVPVLWAALQDALDRIETLENK